MSFKAYETSSAQKRLYMVNRLLGDTTLYNESRVWIIKGNLDPALLEIAVNQLSQRHEALRTCFTTEQGEILQEVHDYIEIDFKYTHMNVTDTDELIENFLIPHDLEKAPLWKIELVQSGRDRQLLLLDFHHIIADGTSMDLIMKELTVLYQDKPLPEPEVQYVDFTIWQNDLFASDTIKNQEAYWLEVFEGELPLLDLPVDSPRSLAADIEGNTFEFEMDEGLTKGVNRLAAQHGTTLYVVLSAVLNVLLSKYSSQEDIVMGTPISGRTHREFRNMVGMFVNTLAMRNKPTADKTFKAFTAEVSRSTFAAFENQDYQFEMLVEKLVPQRQLNRNPLFDVMFALQNYSRNINIPGIGNDELVFIPYSCRSKVSKFDLSLQAFEIDRHILFSLDYRTSLFRKDTIERLSEHFINIFHEVTRNCNIRLSDIRLLSKAEQDRLLYVLNDTAVDYPADKFIHELFELEAEKNPDGTAIVGNAAGGLVPLNVTYKKLNEKSDELAYQLKEKGVQPETIVGIMADRSIETIIALQAILKAGGVYLPIDPGYPTRRIAYILNDSSARILVTTGTPAEENIGVPFLNSSGLIIIKGDRQRNQMEKQFTLCPLCRGVRRGARRGAYIIYTSGSTGTPKGVVVEHRSVIRLVKNTNYIDFHQNERLLQTGALEFDASTFEIWGALLNGWTLYLAEKEKIVTAETLKEIVRKYMISTMWLTSPLFNQLCRVDAEIFKGLKYLLVGGDVLSPSDIDNLRARYPRLKVINGYGPTENTTFSTTYLIEREYTKTIPIGRPIANSTAYIAGRSNHLQPVGVPGELWVGGDGLARGYLNNPELTAEKFDRDLWRKGTGKILNVYKTGDLARWLSDGNIEFIGRIDQQVKIRGFRIELGEIESRLVKHPQVKEALVLAVDADAASGEKYLCAYIVAERMAQSAWREGANALREYLSQSLPDYMIPSHFISIEKIPLNPNGKVDRKALTVPEITAGEKYEAPGNEIEETLAAIWSEVLNIDKEVISIDGNFFELGGHSLKAAVVISKIHKELDVKLELAELFSTPFIRGLAERIKGTAKERYAAVEAVEKKDYYVLSPAQKRLYILQQLDPESTAYNMPLPIPLPAEPDTERLQRTFNRLIERHESLRTSFFPVNEEPVQRIHEEEKRVIIHRSSLITHHHVRPFDLSRPPLLRAGVIKAVGGNTFLLVDMHHIAADGTSLNILEKEFMSLYSLEGEDLPVLRLQYKDYAQWQNSLLQQELMKQQASYWTGLFSGQLPVLNLSTDYPRPLIQSFEGAAVDFVLNEQETQRLKDIAKKTDATLYMVVLSVYTILLSKLSGQEDIIVGTPVAARRHADLEHIIGMFVNTLALRNYPESKKAFKEFLIQLRNSTLEAFENQEYPFENLVDQVSPRRDTSRNPIFDAMFNLWDQPDYRDRSQEKKRHGLINNTAKFDLNLLAIVIGDGEKILFNLEYGTRLFNAATIERIIGYFKNIVSLLPEDINKPWTLKLSEIEIMTEEEKKKILEISRGPQEEWDEEETETIHHWFEKQVEQTPDNIAAVGGAHGVSEPRALTYRELNRKSNQLAYLLKEKGVQSNSIVGLMVGRSLEMLISILAIMKAGGAYLPVDEEYPGERKKYMLEDSEVKLLLTNHDIESQTGYISKDIEVIDPGNETIYRGSDINPGQVNGKKGSNLVYLIYTSGSTGKPKGVMLEHRNLVNLIRFQYKSTNLDCSRILQFAAISFDVSFQEIFSALLCGGSLYLVDKETRTNIPGLFTFIDKNEIKTLFLPMSLLKLIFSDDDYIHLIPGCIKHIQTAGEQVVVSHRFRDYLGKNNIYLHNHYGPSEAHVVTTLTMDPREDIPGRPSIGKPIANTTIYIVDKGKHLLPVGVPGELYIGGIQVGRGYLGREKLTAEKFIMYRPIDGAAPQRVYRTGDLSRWLSDGNIEFLGRIDHQVKLRGFRVELGEIESRLLNHDEIKEAVVLARTDGDDRAAGPGSSGDKYLCAYIAADKELSVPQLSEYLSGLLPDYMIPSYFVFMEKIPLTPNGKIDRRALPAPLLKAGEGYIAPGNEIEKKLVEIWSGVLGIADDVIGIDGNFFQLGGHSLKATVMAARVHKALNVTLPLAEVFKTPTIRGLAKYITGTVKDKYTAVQPVEKKDYYSLSSAQKRLYILQQMDLESTAYNLPRVIPWPAEPDMKRLEKTFIQLIRCHESLRTSFFPVAEEPVQGIHEKNYKLQIINYKSQITDVIKDFVRPFDLSQAPLLRAGLAGAEGKYLLMVDMHHIITDGISQGILEKEFMMLYREQGADLPRLRIQYKDFSVWQNSRQRQELVNRQESYWTGLLSGQLPVLNLPTDFPRPLIQSFAGCSVDFGLSAQETRRLRDIAKEAKATLYMVVLSLYTILLSKLSGQEDIIAGTAIAARRHADLQRIIGMFVNSLALRNYPAAGKSFKEFLGHVKESTLGAYENQEYQFEDLVDNLSVPRDTGRNPIFDAMFNMLNPSDDTGDIPDIIGPDSHASPYEHKESTSKFDLTLTAVEGKELFFNVEYCTRLFKAETIERIIGYFKKITAAVIENPRVKISAVEIISEVEKRQILVDFNDTGKKFSNDKTICRLFADQLEKTPDNIALVGAHELHELQKRKNIFLTYNALNRKADQLAHYLYSRGARANRPVGIMVERSLEMIIGILGILKAGCAYVPLNPKAPEARTKYILDECGTKILLTAPDISPVPSVGRRRPQPINHLHLHLSPSPVTSLAYIIFTSGSTGRPKGVPITHANLSPLLHWGYRELGLSSTDRAIQNLSYYFDWSVWEIFITLTSGAGLYMVPNELLLNPEACIAFINRNDITILHITPTQYLYFLGAGQKFETLKYLFLGAEKLTYEMVQRSFESVNKDCRVFNMYGPTEATIIAAVLEIERSTIEQFKNLSSIPIGGPVGNTGLLVLDKYLNACPVNVLGELYIAGDGLARGYLNSPELTSEKFLTAKTREETRRFHMSYMSHMSYIYKTGDLARWLTVGSIEFIGRIDQQVKIRGFRIELGEIENQLVKHPQVKEAVVLVTTAASGEEYLCAFMVFETLAAAVDLKEFLSQSLPDYMIPAHFISIEKIPLNPNGKLDRKALPAPEAQTGDEYIAPSNEVEERLASIWSEVLAIEKNKISIDANFFELGGHSLNAMVLSAKIHKVFNVKIPLVELFRLPTARELAQYIKKSAEDKYTAIAAAEEKEYYVLSSAQKRLYILQQMEPDSIGYNMPQVIPLPGDFEMEKLAAVFNELIERHESLRTSYMMVNAEPVQRVHDGVEFEIEYQDLDRIPAPRAFDLSRAPLLRVELIKIPGGDHLLMVDMHHIISDGVSNVILANDFGALYRGSALPILRLRYRDYAGWQNSKTQIGAVKKQQAWWLKQFEEDIPVLDLPTDYSRPRVQSFEGSAAYFTLDPAETNALETMAAREDATLYMVLLAVFNLLLSRLSGREDIVVGSPTAGRRHEDLQHIIGMFVNTLALRNYPAGEKSFEIFMREVKENTLAAFENQDYQFDDLVEKVAAGRDTGRNPVFDTMFALQNLAGQRAVTPGPEQRENSKSPGYETMISKFDLTLTAVEGGGTGTVAFSLEYCTRLFKPETIHRFIGYFKNTVTAVIENPRIKISGIEIISEAEKRRILMDFNDTAASYPANKTIHRLFEEQADKNPDGTAIVGKPARGLAPLNVTYKKLNEKSSGLACVLNERGIQPGAIVGLMKERSVEMIIDMLGILKAGAAYLPLDPGYPKERIDYILKDSGAEILLATLHPSPFTPHPSPPTLRLAYVIYTSGTTGKPKGVMITHRNVVRLVKNSNVIPFTPADRLLLTGKIVFDITTFEIWGPLLNGPALFMVNQDDIMDGGKLGEILRKHDISILHLIPQLFNQLAEQHAGIFAELTYLLVGGDIVRPHYINKLRKMHKNLKLLHMYGPTENTTFSTFFPVEKEYESTIPIGKPINNSTVYIIDRHGNLKPFGVVGDLYIGGPGIARGYLNNPELTAEKFCLRRPGGLFLKKTPPWTPRKNFSRIKQMFCGGPGGGFSKEPPGRRRQYKTGDLARWLADGNIEFMGRIDSQVKIRGIRIELAGIESQLLKHELISEAAVIDRREDNGEKYLCAYIVAKKTFNPPELNDYLSKSMPAYMIPAFYVNIDSIPVTANGKVDRNALPAPGIAAGEKYEAPVSRVEKILASIWSEILHLDREVIGIDNNFFELGGHSLKATTMISRLHKELDVRLELAEVFRTPFIRGLAEKITGTGADRYAAVKAVEKKDYYTASSAQKRLYVLQQMEPESTAYNMPQVIPLPEGSDTERLEKIFIQLIQRHESLRTSFLPVNGEPVQRTHDKAEFKIENYLVRPFDLSRPPLLRAGVIKAAGEDAFLFLDMHHIITDAASQAVLAKEFMTLYTGEELAPPRLYLQYKDYAEWQNSPGQRDLIKWQQSYWVRLFSGQFPVLDLPADYPRPLIQSFEGSTVDFALNKQETQSLHDIAGEANATLYMVLLSVYTIFLSKLSGQEDIIVGTPIAARRHADLENIIGMFVNTLPMRNYPAEEKPFAGFLKEVRQNTIAAYENQEYPFEELVEEVEVSRDAGRNPLFDVVFTFLDRETGTPTPPPEQPGTKIPALPHQVSKFDMTLTAVNRGSRLFFSLEYCTRLFNEKTIRRFTGYFKRIISCLVQDPRKEIAEIEIITEAEKKQILEEFNGAISGYPKDRTIHCLFEEQAVKGGDGVAVIGRAQSAERMVSVSYKELNKEAHRSACLLKEKGVRPGDIVGIAAGRTIGTIAGILAILKAGAAYLPIDPDYPEERKQYMLTDSGARMLVTMDDPINHQPSTPNIEHRALNNPSAYIIYTSGTTGKPKGMIIEHRNVVSLMKSDRFLFDFGNTDVWTLFHSFCFDFSVWEMYGALLYGGKLIVIPGIITRDTARYLKILKQQSVTVLNQTPSAFYHLIDVELKCPGTQLRTRVVIFGGEALKPGKLRDWRAKYPGTKLVNMFGITETTVHVTYKELGQEDIRLGISNIGGPLPTLTAYIMNNRFKLLPVGAAGECYIGGAGVGRGYLNRVPLTREKFVENPYNPGEMLYKSGDLIRFLANGEMEYLGRIDHQVKIRGFRIETGEIENRLAGHKNIKEAVVLALQRQENEPGSLYLCAYYISDIQLTVAQLREYLLKHLPGYMIPRYFMPVEKIPLTPNGKVDRKSLPHPEVVSTARYVAPKSGREKLVAETWARVLDLEEVGAQTNFFELGGNSLDFIKINSILKEALNKDIPVAMMFRYPTVGDFAAYLSREKETPVSDRKEEKTLGRKRLGKMRGMKKKRD